MIDFKKRDCICAFIRKADVEAFERKSTIIRDCIRMGSNRVNRGGSWNNYVRNCRVANRNNNTPDNRNNNLGLRLAL
ncbi:MAG: SUMF1/EgtB/PvdO family nonheme iron enzyme [Bacteroidaceae bacterium]|nr:SUMF1/EgtB/PvdO family nonheme iron enzyme [Bacteroidaceae bacterium]